jgi:hypothetical protein
MRQALSRSLLVAMVAAVAACGERPPPIPLTVPQVLDRPARLESTVVRGRAFPVGQTQFVLAGGERSIFVFADPAVVGGIRRPGQVVLVSGSVQRLEGDQAIELADEVAMLSPARGPAATARRPPEVIRARRTQGAPYIELRRIRAVSR